MSAALITALSSELLKRYAKKKLGDLLPKSEEDITNVLNVLVPGWIKLGGAKSVTPALIKKVEDQIKRLQGHAGNLLEDEFGILGRKTLTWLRGFKRCKGELEHSPTTKKVPKPGSGSLRKIRYHYDSGSLPNVPNGNAEELLAEAFISWIRVIKLDVLRANSKDGANVIVTTTDIDGQGGTLADAHVGPPQGLVMSLRFDSTEPWTPTKFRGTSAHEIGHLLGLRHGVTGTLMQPFFDDNIISPTDKDVQAAVKAGWKKKTAKPKPKRVAPKKGKPVIDPDAAV